MPNYKAPELDSHSGRVAEYSDCPTLQVPGSTTGAKNLAMTNLWPNLWPLRATQFIFFREAGLDSQETVSKQSDIVVNGKQLSSDIKKYNYEQT